MIQKQPITQFIKQNYRHFNAATLVDAAEAYRKHLDQGGKMFIALAGAMSTAELGISLAEMIRQGKVHGICCTGANLEEDVFNLVAHSHYKRVPNYRDLSPGEELVLRDNGYNRVTDTCIPEEKAVRRVETHVFNIITAAEKMNERLFPHEVFYRLLRSGVLKEHYEIDSKDSWLLAAAEKDLPIFVPGWEDSTLGNCYAVACMRKEVKSVHTIRSGIEYMIELAEWYQGVTKNDSLGFFQIGGGIAGDFPICVVPLLHQDMKVSVKMWGYFCQVSDSTTSYGSYSGAVPNEKISWGKLLPETPRFVIESDATIVAPLIFAYVLDL